MSGPRQQLQVTVVGNGDVASLDSTAATDRSVSVSTTGVDGLSPQGIEADCLVVDGPNIESWDGLVDRVTDRRPRLPVVVLVEGSVAAGTIGDAIEAGAADYLPRSLWSERPSLVARRLASVVDEPESVSADEPPANPDAGTDSSADRLLDGTARGLFESVSDGLVIHETETGTILDCNRRFCELTDYSCAELLGRTVDCVVATGEEYSYEQARARIRRAAEAGPQLFEWRGETQSGETFPVEVHLDQTTIDDTECVVASVRDITDRRARQQRLEAARDRRSVLFENSPDPIVTVAREDGQPHITEVNTAFEETFGFDEATAVDRPLSEVVVPEERQDRHRQLRARAQSGDSLEAEVRRETADGLRDFLIRVLPYQTDDDSRAYVWYTDITDRKERERALERERDQRSVLFENNPDPVAGLEFVDGEPIIREVNPAFENVFGFDAETVLGATVDEAVVPEDERGNHDRLRKQAAAGETIEAEGPRQTADGRRQFVFRVIQFNDDPGTTDAYVWYTDVTERRRHERAVETLQEATGQMQRVNSHEAVADIAVEAAREALDLPVTICWLQDDETARLDPVAATDAAHERGLWKAVTPECAVYDSFEADEMAQYGPDEHGVDSPLSGLFLPLGDHGLLAAGHENGSYDDVILDVAATLAEQTETALSRVQRAQEVRESERRLQAIVDRIDEAIYLAPVPDLNATDIEPDFVSSGYEDIWGQSLETIHDRHEEGFFGTIHPEDYEGYVGFIQRLMAAVEAGDPAASYSREYRIQRPDGEVRWVHSDFYPTDWAEGPRRMVIASRDITARKERHRTLESFHDATAELTTADTVDEAGRLAVEAAASVFELPATAVYHYDADTATLDPRATGPELPPPAELPPLDADYEQVWEAFIGEGMTRVTVDDEPPLAVGPAEELLVFPLGGNGVLAVWRSGETFDTDAASILAATLEAALNRLRGERQLESRRKELEAQTERAQRLDAVAELTQRVEAAITTTSSREGIQEAVCAELVDVEPISGAWIAAAEVGTDRLTPRAVAGVDRDHVEQALASSADGTDPHPAVEAWQRGEVRVVSDLVGSGRRSDWRQLLLKNSVGAVCAVPLAYSSVTYGVVTILADDPDAFGQREREVLAQLSRSIGYAITAIERRRALESDDTVELEFEGREMDLPVARLADETGCQVRHERTVRRQDGSVSVYYSLRGELPEEIETDAAEILPGSVTVVSRQEGELVVERQGSSWFGSLISEYGGVLRRGRATPSGLSLLVELPQEADVRTIVERLQAAFPALDLTAKRQHRETTSTPSDARSRIEQRLTDRQYEAIETAHAMGYFEWPRENSGEEVADSLGITQPTVNKHIRLGERKVFDFLFDGE
ncbi:MAG: PAS domain S-box protein [Euryarchaeota archaeon]|nr:PAS domain S-box protein [Euryarchaeota archaeon]